MVKYCGWSKLSSTDMDPQIWRRLPEDLLDRILSFLPLKSLFDLRSTCKHFNSIFFSPHFLSCSHSLSSFILLSHPQCLHRSPIFNTDLNSWSWSTLPPFSFPPSSTLLSSSNGLLCFSIPSSSSFLVCNLLTRSSRTVPFPTSPFTFDLLPTLVADDDGYNLFILSSTGSSSTTVLLYSSNPGSWQQFTTSVIPALTDSHHQKGVPHGGCLYFTTAEPFHAVRFCLQTGAWESPSAGALPAGLTFARLVGDGEEKLYLVGGVGVSGISRSMKLWELEEDEGGRWKEIETLPEMIYRKFVSVCYHNYEHVYCFWNQGLICVCCYTWPEILYYRVSRRTWHWLPKSPSLPEKWSCGFRWFPFNPHLYATA